MSMTLSKTELVDDDYPAGGSSQTVTRDVISGDKVYATGSYSADAGSWSGSRFLPAGAPPWTRPYGFVQVGALELVHAPFICHPAASFPADPDQVAQCQINISGGTIIQHREDLEWMYTATEPSDGEWYLYKGWIDAMSKWQWLKRTVAEVPMASGVVGLAAIVKESSGLIARPVCVAGDNVALDAGVIRADEFASALIDWSSGRCFGFEWFLLPGSASILAGSEGTEGGMDAVLEATSGNTMSYQIMEGVSRPAGSAWCSWVEYQGMQFTGGRVTFSSLGLPSGSRTPEAWPPRMD